jgi:hypothetical protein
VTFAASLKPCVVGLALISGDQGPQRIAAVSLKLRLQVRLVLEQHTVYAALSLRFY